jgi:hypothetical protein
VKPPIIVLGPAANPSPARTAQSNDMILKPVAPNAVRTAQPVDLVEKTPTNAVGTAQAPNVVKGPQPDDMIQKPGSNAVQGPVIDPLK